MFDRVFGIDDLERDIQQFKQDIENAKATYISEYAEYINITTDFENVEEKYDFLQEETEALTVIFPEEDAGETLSNVASGFFYAATVLEIVAVIGYVMRRVNMWKLTKILATIDDLDETIRVLSLAPNKAGKVLGLQSFVRAANSAKAAKAAKTAKIAKVTKIAQVSAAAGAILGIVSLALDISSAVQRKEYLEEHKKELKEFLDEFNGYIADANDATKNVINAFLTYFDELEIDVDGVFNENKDGFLDESGEEKFDDPENGLVSQIREILNGAIKRIGELNAAIKLANRRIDRYISQGLEGTKLIEEVVFDTELPEELIQRLYVFKLRELGNTVQQAIGLSGLAEDIVRKVYARAFLDDGKTVEDAVELSGLTEDEVRRIFVSKLLDDELNAENPDDVIDVKAIAEKAGVSDEIVREIRAQKLAAFPEDEES